jgi:murein DD-endopeptidase MepM/ murein hydrolase activator NlpD
MPLRQGETIPQMVVRVAREQGLDARATKIALAIVAQESGFDPQAEGDWSSSKKRNRSIGLFQLNEEGLGSGMGDTRYDPEANANRGIKNLQAVYAKHSGLSDGEIAYNAQRPANKQEYVGSINAKTSGQDPQWTGTINTAAGHMAGPGTQGAPVFPVAGQNLQTARVTTEHGARGSNTGYAGVPESHRGTDFSAGKGSAALATVPGTVAVAHKWTGDKSDPYGNYIDIKGQDGKTYRYAHLQDINVQQGATVGGGQTIGTVDSTGNSTGDHLHFEVIGADGKTQDPKAFLANSQSGSGGRGVADTSEASNVLKRLQAQQEQLKAKADASAAEVKAKAEREAVLEAEKARLDAKKNKSGNDITQLQRTNAELNAVSDQLPILRETAKQDAELVRAQEMAIGRAEDAIAGKALDPSVQSANEAQAAQARANAAKIEHEVSQSKNPDSPENQQKLAQAALWRKQAGMYDEVTKSEIAARGAQAEAARGSAAQSNAQAKYILGTLDSTIEQHAAAAGLNRAQTDALKAKLQPEIDQIVATTSKIGADANYTRALTEAVNKKLPVELAKAASEIKLTDAQALALTSKLPGDLVLQGTQARLEQAQAEAQRASGISNLASAHKTDFDMKMEAWKAERMAGLTKLMATGNVTSEDIGGFLMGAATNATELVNAHNAEVARRSSEESARNLRVREGIDIQNADESMRNNLANNITSYMNARTGQQNASTQAVGPTLGAARVANTLAGLGPLMGEGDAGIKGIAAKMGVGQGVLGGVLSGLKEYQGTIKGFKDQMPNVRMANPNVATPSFVSPGIGKGIQAGASAGAAGSPPPKAPNLNLPTSVPADAPAVVQQAAARDVNIDASQAGNTPPDQMDDTGNALPQQPPEEPGPEHEEDEEHQGGGGGYSFKAPRGHGRGGGSGGKKRPSRAARAMGAFTPPGVRRAA